jgi:dienelactone hydrolase
MIEQIDSGFFARPPSEVGTSPGVLIFHGGGGLTDHERDRAQMVAALGYIAYAPDLFGETFVDRGQATKVIGQLVAEPARLRQRTTAALARLASMSDVDPGRIAVIGHCFGGLAALELARSGADVRAAVSFHGRLANVEPARRGEIRARVLVCTGAKDPFCPRDHRIAFEDEMTAAGADWQHHVYADAMHGFSVPSTDPSKQPGCAYHELADHRSWAAMLGLFAEVMAPDLAPRPSGREAQAAAKRTHRMCGC